MDLQELEVYEDHGVRFCYPQGWEIQEQPLERGVTIAVNSPDTSFWTLSLEFDGPDPQQILQAAVEVFRTEYNELDAYPADEEICHRAAAGRDLEFVCLDVLNSAALRSFRTGEFTVLILYQGTDNELVETRDVLQAITASLTCDGDNVLWDDEGMRR